MTESRTRRRLRWRIGVYGSGFIILLAVSISGCSEVLFYHPTKEPTPAPLDFEPAARKVEFTSEDGTKLCGWFIPSAVGSTKNAATVVHLHGNAGSMLSHRFFVEWLPAAGFNVFMFDFRGYGESEGNARMREGLVQDARAALKTVRAKSEIDPGRIALLGQSLGGAIAAVVAAEDFKNGGNLRAIVLESPFASWRDVAANSIGGDPPNFFGKGIAWLFIRDETSTVARPEDAIKLVSCPVLILHGDADAIAPVSHGRRLAAAAPSGVLLEYSGGQHNSLQQTHPESRAKVLEFLRKNTGPVQAK